MRQSSCFVLLLFFVFPLSVENIIRQRCRLRVLFQYVAYYSNRILNIIVYRKEKKRRIIGRQQCSPRGPKWGRRFIHGNGTNNILCIIYSSHGEDNNIILYRHELLPSVVFKCGSPQKPGNRYARNFCMIISFAVQRWFWVCWQHLSRNACMSIHTMHFPVLKTILTNFWPAGQNSSYEAAFIIISHPRAQICDGYVGKLGKYIIPLFIMCNVFAIYTFDPFTNGVPQ